MARLKVVLDALSAFFIFISLGACTNPNHHLLGPSVGQTPSGSSYSNNGAWPTLTNFNLDVTSNNAGAGGGNPNSVAYDGQDGCGSSTSTATLTQQTTGGHDGSPYANFTYTVGTNAGCGYQYAALYFPLVNAAQQNLSGTTGVSFWVKASAASSFTVNLKGAASDPCLPGTNQMNQAANATTSWQQLRLPFSSFIPKNGACPFYNAGTKKFSTPVGSITFIVTALGSGTLYFDDLQFY